MGNILVVDDEPSIRLTVKAFLKYDGHSVLVAENARVALELFEQHPVDVVLTDIILPEISGVELLRKIRERSADVQVIMMTGEPTMETVSESLRLGAVDYLQKPIGKNDILKTVRNALYVKQLKDEKQRLERENQNYLVHLEQLVVKRTQALAASEEMLRHRAEELFILNRLARSVNENISLDNAVQCGLREIMNAVNPDLVVFFLLSGGELVLRGSFSNLRESDWAIQNLHKVGSFLCGLATTEGKAFYSNDIKADPRCTLPESRKASFRSFAALPLVSGTETIGVLGIASLSPRDFQEQASLLEALANEMSVGLKKNLLYEEVQRHAQELKTSLTRIEEAEEDRRSLQHHLQQSQKMEAIGTLASGIAHDFNNILGAVIGYAELALLNAGKDSKTKSNIEMILAASSRAKDLISQILAFSRQSDEERKPVQVDAVLEEVVKFMRASLPATIDIRKDIAAPIDDILADPVQIHQVLMNLCTNALHAMGEHGGILDLKLASVTVSAEHASELPNLKPGIYVKMTVRDNGHGMSEAIIARIFDPYFTTKGMGVGTGLGLSVVHGIVKKYEGAIRVQSELGKGSVFDLYFPAIPKEKRPEAGLQEQLLRGQESILLIDDELALVDMGKEMLEYLGYQVEAMTSSVDALSLFKSNPLRFDLVITDMTMPNMTGDTLAEELRRIRKDIPVILCTGYSERLMEEKAKAANINGLVMKPVLMAKLARAIREALDKQQGTSSATGRS